LGGCLAIGGTQPDSVGERRGGDLGERPARRPASSGGPVAAGSGWSRHG